MWSVDCNFECRCQICQMCQVSTLANRGLPTSWPFRLRQDLGRSRRITKLSAMQCLATTASRWHSAQTLRMESTGETMDILNSSIWAISNNINNINSSNYPTISIWITQQIIILILLDNLGNEILKDTSLSSLRSGNFTEIALAALPISVLL